MNIRYPIYEGVYRILTLYKHAHDNQDKDCFQDKGECPEGETDQCSGHKEQDRQVHGNDALAVKQAYSRKQNQCAHLPADVFDEFQFHVFKFLRMNNPIGICFPDFIGLRPLDCLFAQGLAKENTAAKRG